MQLDNLPSLDNTFDVPVSFDADGEPTMGFKIVGKNSEQHQAQYKKNTVSGIKRGAKKKSQIDASTDAGAEELSKLIDKNNRLIAEAVIVGWYGFTSNGKPAEFDRAQVTELFNKYPTWVEKVQIALENDANFMTL